MDFSLTEEQTMIRDAAGDFLAGIGGTRAARSAMATESGFEPDVWRQLAAELGWCAIPVPEAYGGLGLGPVEMALIQEQAGRHLLCAPFFSTVCLAANLLQETGSEAARERYLPAIAAGEIVATVPMPSRAGDFPPDATARRDGDAWVLDGECPRVPDGAAADWLFLLAAVDGGGEAGLFAVPRDADGVRVRPLETWDATRKFAEIALDAAPAAIRCDDPGRLAEGRGRAAALARLYVAAESVGVAQQCLDLTVAYAGERRQFGRPIASFQAVKHRCAQMMVRCEAARSAVHGAAVLAADAPESGELAMECAVARVVADDAAFFCAAEAIQLHGGVGFTWEYDPQLYFKRAQAARHWLGDPDALCARIAAGLMDGERAA